MIIQCVHFISILILFVSLNFIIHKKVQVLKNIYLGDFLELQDGATNQKNLNILKYHLLRWFFPFEQFERYISIGTFKIWFVLKLSVANLASDTEKKVNDINSNK